MINFFASMIGSIIGVLFAEIILSMYLLKKRTTKK